MAATATREQLPGRHDGHAGEQLEVDTRVSAGRAECDLPALRQAAHVGGGDERLRAGGANDPHRLAHRVAPPDDQVTSASPQRPAEIDEAFEQEPNAIRCGATE